MVGGAKNFDSDYRKCERNYIEVCIDKANNVNCLAQLQSYMIMLTACIFIIHSSNAYVINMILISTYVLVVI